MRWRTSLAILAVAAGSTGVTTAQSRPQDVVAQLADDQAIMATIERLRVDEPRLIEEQVRLCEIPAPPFAEEARGRALHRAFEELGLGDVRTDAVGNVLGTRPGAGSGPHLVFTAHLDTVFPAETDVSVRREGAVLHGPGIADDCRGLAVILGVIRALQDGNHATDGPITFVGTVGEEGLGDLRGVKHLFAEELAGQIDRFISVDGTRLGATHVAVGSKRYRVTYKGPGGHSFGAFGLVSPVHALGRAIQRIARFEVPENPKTTFNVGRVGGGTSINSIAFESWMEVDMRSADTASLARLDAMFHEAVEAALRAENNRGTGDAELTVDVDLVGDRPAGNTPEESPIVIRAAAVADVLGIDFSLGEGSTDSNIAMSIGIPALTIGGGGIGRDAHSLRESFDTTESWLGTQRAFLLALALSAE
ncbi:MAG: M20/M25/M40 family metallo-hydrolase [Acidobacteria bacterium]|nr:M20/M25/M40 family metallo-hydrolase [Acidobacteriota bacterium]